MATRDELVAVADRYLDAVAANDPSRAPFAPNARFSENCQPLDLGRGLWRTATGRTRGGSYAADVSTGQVAYIGSVIEAGTPVLLSMRLELDGGQISEAETFLVRTSRIMDAAAIVKPRQLYLDAVEPSQRGDRASMIAAANAYFDGIEQNDGDMVPVTDGCIRIENGVQTILNRKHASPAFRMGVAEQIRSGACSHIETVRERRFPIVDEERGLVFAIFFFDHPGWLNGKPAGASPFKFPNSMMAFELFKIAGGSIHQIEAIADVFPYGSRSGWA
jgi:hypothetical protein